MGNLTALDKGPGSTSMLRFPGKGLDTTDDENENAYDQGCLGIFGGPGSGRFMTELLPHPV